MRRVEAGVLTSLGLVVALATSLSTPGCHSSPAKKQWQWTLETWGNPKLERVDGPITPTGGWAGDGYYSTVKRPPRDVELYGSWAGSDANTGSLELPKVKVLAGERLCVPLVTGPVSRNLSLSILDVSNREVLVRLTPPATPDWVLACGAVPDHADPSPSSSSRLTRERLGANGSAWGGHSSFVDPWPTFHLSSSATGLPPGLEPPSSQRTSTESWWAPLARPASGTCA